MTTVKEPKKWNWDRSQQEVRNAIVLDPRFIETAKRLVSYAGIEGASITTILRELLAEAEAASNQYDPDDVVHTFLAMDRTNQRLVIRKILHNGYRNGKFKLVEAKSTYRTGKKANTKNYVLITE